MEILIFQQIIPLGQCAILRVAMVLADVARPSGLHEPTDVKAALCARLNVNFS